MIHQRLDGTLDQSDAAKLARHRESCPDCAQREAELQLLIDGLRELPTIEFPAEDLERVWDRTVRAPVSLEQRRGSGQRRPSRWLTAAAAAALFAGVVGPAVYEDYQRRRALNDFRLAMQITHRALEKTAGETHEVLHDGVIGTMQRIPGLGPAVGASPTKRRR